MSHARINAERPTSFPSAGGTGSPASDSLPDNPDYEREREAHRVSDRRHQASVENAADAMALTDAAGEILEVRASLRPVLGYAPEELVGQSCVALTHPDDREAVREEITRCLRGRGATSTSLARIRHKDGSWRWIESVRTNQLHDPDVSAVVVNYRDLTERIEAGEAARSAQERFRQLVQNVKDYAIFTLDVQGLVTDWNEGAEKITGYSAEEIIGRHFSIFYTEEDVRAGKPEHELKTAATEGRSEDESWRVRKGGARFWGNEVITALKRLDGTLQGFTKITRDLTGRKQAEDALRDSEARLRNFHDALGFGVVAADMDGNITHANQAACEQLGLTLEELQEGSIERWELVHENGAPVSPGQDPLSIARRTRADWRGIYGIYRGSQSGRWLLIYAVPLFTPTTLQLREAVASFVDITDRLRAEEALRRAYDELEGRVRERTLELAETNASLGLEVAERKQTEEALRDANVRLRALIESSPLAIVELDMETRVKLWNPAAERIFGWRAVDVLDRPLPVLGCEERDVFRSVLAAGTAGKPLQGVEARHVRKDDSTIEVHLWTAPLLDARGNIIANMGLIADVSERKQAERERQALLQRLVSAHEEERGRIARELHDETGQYLSALLLGLSQLSPERGDERRLEQLKEIARKLDLEIDRLALELRPPALDRQCLQDALEAHIQEWSERSGVPVDFHCPGLDAGRLAAEVEATAYRITQEALTNVLKHARATQVSLIVEQRSSHLLIILEDNGRGFDIEALGPDAGRKGHLGLVGMKERVALVGGTLTIESSPGVGTSILARLPLPPAPPSSTSG